MKQTYVISAVPCYVLQSNKSTGTVIFHLSPHFFKSASRLSPQRISSHTGSTLTAYFAADRLNSTWQHL